MTLPPAILARLSKDGVTARYTAEALGIPMRVASRLLRETVARVRGHGRALYKLDTAPRGRWEPL